MEKRIKRRIGALMVFGMFVVLMLAQPNAASIITMGDDEWIGFDGGAQIIFDDTPDPDDIEMMNASVGIGDKDPDFKLEVNGTSENGYFGVSSASDGDIFVITGEGKVGVNILNPLAKVEIRSGGTTEYTSALHVKDIAYTSLFIVKDDGHVGIGVTDPAEKLEIDGNILFNTGADRNIYVEQPLANHDGYKLNVFAGDANYLSGVLGFAGGDLVLHAGDGAGPLLEQALSPGGDVYIYGGDAFIGNDGDVILAHTRTSARGKVGIGTDSPVSTLDVAGTLTVDYSIQSSSIYGLSLHDGIRIFNDRTVLIGMVHGWDTPDTPLEISVEGIEKSNIDILTISNYVYGEDNDGTSSSIVFNQWYREWPYYEVDVDDAGRISVGIEPGHDWIQNPATHDSYMAFQTSLDGTVDEKVRITCEGRVGIGTTSPTGYAVLHLREDSGDNAIAFSVGDDDADFIMGIDATDSKFKIHSGTSLVDTSDFTITTDGNVGIGTSSPERPLHIVDVLRLEPRSTEPSSPSEGDIYVNSSSHHIYCYLANTWVMLDYVP